MTLNRDQGKPWAMLSWPLRATHWQRPNSSAPYDAKHILKCLGAAPPQLSRPVGYGLIRAGVRTDSMIGVTKFRIQKMLNIYVVPLELAAPDQTVPYRTVLSGDAFRALHARLRSRLSLRDPLANISQHHLASLHRSQIFGDL